jgi:MFS family permease
MTSLVIQNIIFIILVIGFGFVAKRYGRKIKSSFKILAGIIILWIASFLSFFDQFWLQISLLTAGVFISVAGMLSFAKELKRVDFNIDSVEKAVDSILTGVGGKTASIYLINERNNQPKFKFIQRCKFRLINPNL